LTEYLFFYTFISHIDPYGTVKPFALQQKKEGSMSRQAISIFISLILSSTLSCGDGTDPIYEREVYSAESSNGGSSADATEDGGTGSENTDLPMGCDTSPYQWGDEVLYVCPGKLPLTEMSGNAFIQVGSFTFVNYEETWKHVTHICLTSINTTSLDTVSQISLYAVPSSSDSIVLVPPWPEDGNICTDVTATVGAESIMELAVFIFSSPPPALPMEATYRFEIKHASDVSLYADDGIVVGDFPVKSETVTIVSQ
jgi:hypothetical protein